MIMTQRFTFFMSALFFVVIFGLTSAFELNKIQHHINHPSILKQDLVQEDCKNASIYEYINKFTLPLSDVQKLLANQFSRNTISDFQASNKVKLFNINFVSKLLTNDQSESPAGPFKASVYNNQIEFTITYKLNITEGTLKKTHTFDAITKVSNVSISYEKEFKLDTGVFVINTASVKLQPGMMISTFTPAANKTQQGSFETAIKGAAPSLYSTFSKIFSNDIVKQCMQSNSKGDHLSKIYNQNPYVYQFYATNISVDLSAVSFLTKNTSLNNTSLTSGMLGKLSQGNSFCSQFVPDFTNTGASLFFAKEFIQNFIQYNIASYPGWKNIRVNKTSVGSTLLQWKLLDLQFIVDGLWEDLGEFNQNEIKFTCDIQSQVSTKFDPQNNRLHQAMAWRCQGFVKLNSTTDQKVMDFIPRINHLIDFQILNGQINMYVNQLQIIDCQFNDVVSLNGQGKYTVGPNGAKIAYKFIQSVFNDFRIYPIGNRFKINANANAFKVEAAGNGLWVL